MTKIQKLKKEDILELERKLDEKLLEYLTDNERKVFICIKHKGIKEPKKIANLIKMPAWKVRIIKMRLFKMGILKPSEYYVKPRRNVREKVFKIYIEERKKLEKLKEQLGVE